jgi:hypothetical protein
VGVHRGGPTGQARSAQIAARRDLERWEAALREWAVLALTAVAGTTALVVALFA